MSILTRWFSKKKEEDYETILSELAADISKRQTKLSEIRLRERRSTLLVTLYTLGFWVAYVSMWYMNILPGKGSGYRGKNSGVEKALKGLPVVVGPVVILFIRRIVQIWYQRKGDAEEKTLQALRKQQRTKVEEIKKKTNYYTTHDLLRRYDESSPSSPVVAPQRASVPPQTPMRPVAMPPPMSANGKMQTPAPRGPGPLPLITPQMMKMTPAPQPTVPSKKQWYDKLADALLGDDDASNAPPSSKYALICEKCFAHNGLVPEKMWEDVQYTCPKCGHFNPSARSRSGKQKQAGLSHLSPVSASSRSPSSSPAQRRPDSSRSSHEADHEEADGSSMQVDEDES